MTEPQPPGRDIQNVLRDLKNKMEAGEITPVEAAQQAAQLMTPGNDRDMDVTVPLRAALAAMGRVDMARAMGRCHIKVLDSFGIGLAFAIRKDVGPDGWMPDESMQASPFISAKEFVQSPDEEAIVQAVQYVLEAMDFETHRHEDGTLHISAPKTLHEDAEAMISQFSSELDAIFGEAPGDGGEIMDKWG